jgi:hypothetical protein
MMNESETEIDDLACAKQLLMTLTKQVVSSPTSLSLAVVILLKNLIEREIERCEASE